MLRVSCPPVVRQQPDQPRLYRLLRHAGGSVAVTWDAGQQHQQEALHSGGQCDIIICLLVFFKILTYLTSYLLIFKFNVIFLIFILARRKITSHKNIFPLFFSHFKVESCRKVTLSILVSYCHRNRHPWRQRTVWFVVFFITWRKEPDGAGRRPGSSSQKMSRWCSTSTALHRYVIRYQALTGHGPECFLPESQTESRRPIILLSFGSYFG